MEQDYNLWADLLSTFRACNDWVKALVVVTPWAALVVCYVMTIRMQRVDKKTKVLSQPFPIPPPEAPRLVGRNKPL